MSDATSVVVPTVSAVMMAALATTTRHSRHRFDGVSVAELTALPTEEAAVDSIICPGKPPPRGSVA